MGQSWAHLGRILAITSAIIITAKFTFIIDNDAMLFVTIAVNMTLGLTSDLAYKFTVTLACIHSLS